MSLFMLVSLLLYIGLIKTRNKNTCTKEILQQYTANYKQYFDSKELGYCYDLDDMVY